MSGRAVHPESSRHVLIVEDNDDGLERKPDVAVVDVGLPGRNGYDMARELRAALGDAVTLIALTGYGQADDRRRTLEAGFDAYLTKPARVEDVLRVLADR